VLLRVHAVEHPPVGGVDVLAPADLRPELEDVYAHAVAYSSTAYESHLAERRAHRVLFQMDMRRLVGQNVRLFRNRLGISQEELAFRSGLHRTYVVVIVGRLARALEVDPASLIQSKPKNRV
jgi:hypothetical protein